MTLANFSILLAGVVLNALAQLGLKAATQVTGPLLIGNDRDPLGRIIQLVTVPYLWYAITAYVVSVAVWLVGLSRVPVTQAYPLLSLGYVLNIGLAWWMLGEVPTMQRMMGVIAIIIGVALVAQSK